MAEQSLRPLDDPRHAWREHVLPAAARSVVLRIELAREGRRAEWLKARSRYLIKKGQRVAKQVP